MKKSQLLIPKFFMTFIYCSTMIPKVFGGVMQDFKYSLIMGIFVTRRSWVIGGGDALNYKDNPFGGPYNKDYR